MKYNAGERISIGGGYEEIIIRFTAWGCSLLWECSGSESVWLRGRFIRKLLILFYWFKGKKVGVILDHYTTSYL
jgi:hypothetical protein